jgi:hypothetical protein
MDSGITTRQHQPSAPVNGSETGAEWPTLLGRMLEDLSRVIQLELQLLEARIAPSLMAMADRAIAGLVILCAGVIGGSCLLAALILLLHQWMQWWECLAIAGIAAIGCGLVAYMSVKNTAAHG